MKRARLENMTVHELVDRFIEIGIEQDQALLTDAYAKFNRLYDLLDAVRGELKRRPGDQRRALLRLYNHGNAQVRLNAMKSTLAVAPEAARRALQTLADSGEYPQAGDAGMSLWNLDRGVFKPT